MKKLIGIFCFGVIFANIAFAEDITCTSGTTEEKNLCLKNEQSKSFFVDNYKLTSTNKVSNNCTQYSDKVSKDLCNASEIIKNSFLEEYSLSAPLIPPTAEPNTTTEQNSEKKRIGGAVFTEPVKEQQPKENTSQNNFYQ